jgi:hypothetical protein
VACCSRIAAIQRDRSWITRFVKRLAWRDYESNAGPRDHIGLIGDGCNACEGCDR